MTRSGRTVEQVARDRLHAVGMVRPLAAPSLTTVPLDRIASLHLAAGPEVAAGPSDADPARATAVAAAGPASGSTGSHARAAGRDPATGAAGGTSPGPTRTTPAARARHRAGTRARREAPAGPPAAAPVDARSGPSSMPILPAWPPLPVPPADPAVHSEPDLGPVPAEADVRDVVVRGRQEALAAAAAGYTDAYGHPLDHPGDGEPTARRWWLSTRHAVVAGVAVAILGAGVAVRASTDVPDAPVSIGSGAVAPSTGHAGHVGPAADAAGAGPPAAGDEAGRPAAPGAGGAGTATAGTSSGASAVAPGGAPDQGTSHPGGPGPGSSAPGGVGSVVVHVVGQVPEPGVLTLVAGSRVADAVAAAGGAGPAADLSAVNLARVVVDGEQVHVPAHGEPPRPAPPGGPAAAGAAGAAGGAAVPVDLNAADLTTLDALPGIGPVLAGRILDWRSDNGPFRSVEELGEVSGIGEALLSRLRPLVRV